MHEKITLPNGVRIVFEHMPGMRSAALGIYVRTGSRQEKPSESGSAHFIEHMLFKGTEHRSTGELAREMDAMGGYFNAYTAKEETCFYTRVLDEQLPRAIELLCDIFFHSRFDEEAVQTERGVILEEIGMCEDQPDDLCAERLSALIYKGNALARPVLGRRATLEKMTGARLRRYKNEHYLPGDIVVALAGSFSDRDVEELKGRFAGMTGGAQKPCEPAEYHAGVSVKRRDTEQNHLILAFPGLCYADERRYALRLLSTVLAGGMSSRLWQRLREERGLCYSVYSYELPASDTGSFHLCTAVNRDSEAEALETMLETVQELRSSGVTGEELEHAREEAKAALLLSGESTQARSAALGRGELLLGQIIRDEEVLARYDAVTLEDVRAVAETVLDPARAALSAVGKVRRAEEYRRALEKER